MPNALVSMNGFKGTLTNAEACDIVHEALKKNGISSTILPIGDGGAGTLDAVHLCLGGTIVRLPATGPLGAKVQARVLCLPDDNAPESLYVESAESCGYHLLKAEERDAMRASSQGLGEVLSQSLARWGSTLKRVYVGLGDSAISDAGMGMLSALGYTFRDQGGKTLRGSAEGLRHIHSISGANPKLRGLSFFILCDVMNPLCGSKGSARVFAPQKGATPGQVSLIEQGMEKFAKLTLDSGGRDVRNEPMTGAAGGLAAAFRAYFNAELVLGASFFLDLAQFDRLLNDHTFVVTGEGRVDAQTMSGKAPWECLQRARRKGVRTVVLAGAVGEGSEAVEKQAARLLSCGKEPNAREALFEAALQMFADEKVLEDLQPAAGVSVDS